MNFQETYLVAFLGHTDATGTTSNVVKVSQVFLQCIRNVKFYSKATMSILRYV